MQQVEDRWAIAVTKRDQYALELVLAPQYIGISASGDVTTRNQQIAHLFVKNAGPDSPADFAQLGIHARTVTEVDLQHEDSDVLPASTAVPGDSVLLAGPNRIVVSACGVYFEATRATSTTTRSSGK